MMFSHYQIVQCVVDPVGKGIMIIEQVLSRFHDTLMTQSKEFHADLEKNSASIEGICQRLDKSKVSERPALFIRPFNQSDIYQKF